MNMRSLVAATNAVLVLLLASGGASQAAEVKLLSAEVLRHAINELVGDFERTTGHKLTISYGSAVAVRDQVQGGASADVTINQRPLLEALSEQGKIARGTVVTLARSGLGVGVRKGSPKPDISTVDAFKRTLLNAHSIAYSDPSRGAASGIHFRGVLERLGITQEVNAKAKLRRPVAAGSVADHDAEIVITQPMEILAEPNLELVGWLPDELQDYAAFTWAAGVTANSREPDAAKALIQFLSSPGAAAVIRKKGMVPAAS